MSDTAKNQSDKHRKTVGEWLSRSFEWRVPVYQRHYAWETKNDSGPVDLFWQTLKEQTEFRLQKETPPPHYLGAVLVDNKTEHGNTDDIKVYDLVDGQQRLTTIQIALLALILVAEDYNCGDQIGDELEKYIFSDRKTNKPRLMPTNFDNKQFKKVLLDAYNIVPDVGGQKTSRENAEKSKIVSTCEFFKDKYKPIVENQADDGRRREAICAIKDSLLDGFHFVLIVLRESDNAQQVFESLNNYAEPLTTFDLIRNNVFYRAAKTPKMDEKLFYSDPWQQLERPYWEKRSDKRRSNPKAHIQAYVARMLVARMKKEIGFNRNEIFKAYKEFAKQFDSVKEEIDELVRYVDLYQYLDLEGFKNPTEVADFGFLRPYEKWNNRDFYPVIFSIEGANVDSAEKQRMIKLLESYVIRRAICGFSFAHYNKHAADFCKNCGDDVTYGNLRKFLCSPGPDAKSTVFPTDEAVEQGCLQTNFYGSSYGLPYKRYVFEEIEKQIADKKELGKLVDTLEIDHILPQAWEKQDGWKAVLGRDVDPFSVTTYINTIGNLTLMSPERNNEKSNNPWNDVKELLEESRMQLNRDLAREETWNVAKITERSKKLAKIICEIWPYDIK